MPKQPANQIESHAFTQEAQQIELRSDEVQDILSYIPHWIIRWGTTFILLTIIMLFYLAYIVQYPDVIYGRVALTTKKPPIAVKPHINGQLERLLIRNKQKVKQEEILAIIRSSTTYEKINTLKEELARLDRLEMDVLAFIGELEEINQLGTLQSAYAILENKLQDYQDFVELKRGTKNVTEIRKQIDDYGQIEKDLLEEKKIVEEKEMTAIDNVGRYKALARDSTVSFVKVQEQETELLKIREKLKQLDRQVSENQLKINELEAQIIDIGSEDREQNSTLQLALREALKNMQSELAAWETTYLIRAPIAGEISLPEQVTKTLLAGEEMMTIVPTKAGNIIGKMPLEQDGLGKIQLKQKVIVKLDGYPFAKFGTLEGKIANIDIVPRNGTYLTEIALEVKNDSLQTASDLSIPFQQGMQGTAEVIAENQRLLVRIFDRFKTMFSQ